MTILTAQVTKVQIGLIEIDGLMFEDGSFAIAVPQLTEIQLIPPNRSLKQLESLLDINFQTHQKAITAIHPKAVNTISLQEFIQVLKILAKRENEFAIDLIDSLIGLSLHQLFSDAFGIKFEKEERQSWLLARQAGKVTRRTLTDSIKDWYQRNPNGTSCLYYAMFGLVTDKIYLALWGMKAKEIEEVLSCERHQARDFMSAECLMVLERAENRVAEFIDLDNIKPKDAITPANIRPSLIKLSR